MTSTSSAEVHRSRRGCGESLVRLLVCLKMLLLLVMMTLSVVVVVVVVEVEETSVKVEAGLDIGVVVVVIEVGGSVEIQAQLSGWPEVWFENCGDAEVGHGRRGLLAMTVIAVFIVLSPILFRTVHTASNVTISAVPF